MAISNGGLDFMKDGACAKPSNVQFRPYFFSNNAEERNAAKNLCFTTCPVRKECVVYALESGTIWGVWGGRDDNEIRRTLSVNSEGNETRRGRYPQCPYCSARTSKLKTKTVPRPEGGRWPFASVVECTVCGTEWMSRSSANAVEAYFAERQTKKLRAAAKKRRTTATAGRPRRSSETPES